MEQGSCSIEGCGKPARTRGWCVKHYGLWWRHGDPLTPVRRRPAQQPEPRPPSAPPPPPRPIGQLDAAWLAGLFEGEGTIYVRKNSVGLALGMTDRDVVERVNRLIPMRTGPMLSPRDGHKDYYMWYANRREVVAAALRVMLPWFGERRTRRAFEALAVLERGPAPPATHCKRGHPYDTENTYVSAEGQRVCRTCRRDRNRDYEERCRAARREKLGGGA